MVWKTPCLHGWDENSAVPFATEPDEGILLTTSEQTTTDLVAITTAETEIPIVTTGTNQKELKQSKSKIHKSQIHHFKFHFHKILSKILPRMIFFTNF